MNLRALATGPLAPLLIKIVIRQIGRPELFGSWIAAAEQWIRALLARLEPEPRAIVQEGFEALATIAAEAAYSTDYEADDALVESVTDYIRTMFEDFDGDDQVLLAEDEFF